MCHARRCLRTSSHNRSTLPCSRHYHDHFVQFRVCRPGGGARGLMMTALSKQTLTPDSICHVTALRHVSQPAGSRVVQGLLTDRPHAVLQAVHAA